MADDDETSGRTVRVYDRPADADKPAANPMTRIVLIVVVVLLLALLLAHFVFHVHFRHLLHTGAVIPLNVMETATRVPLAGFVWAVI